MRAPRGLVVFAILLSLLAAACEGGRQPDAETGSTPLVTPRTPHAAPATSANVDYESPFSYCGQVVSADEPGAPYAGEPQPTDVFLVLADLTGIPQDAGVREETPEFSWRCMDGFVYACTYGPNLPCGKADLRSSATPEMVQFCNEHFPGTPLPGSLTGHQTIYSWVCRGETPATTHQKYQVDPRGFVAGFWHWIPEPETSPGDDGDASETAQSSSP